MKFLQVKSRINEINNLRESYKQNNAILHTIQYNKLQSKL